MTGEDAQPRTGRARQVRGSGCHGVPGPASRTHELRASRWVSLALAAVAPGILAAAACGGEPRTGVDGDMAFVGVNVLPMDAERVLEHQTVVVDEGRIASIDPSGRVEPAEGVEVVEADGHYLLPGLAEMHGHLPNPRMSDEDIRNLLFLYLANGVTTVRGMQGDPSQFDLRASIERGRLLGPHL